MAKDMTDADAPSEDGWGWGKTDNRTREERSRVIANRAVADCLAMLKDTMEGYTVPRETLLCEHDYRPSPRYLEADECTKCGDMVAADLAARQWFDEAKRESK